jgi:hypothetical protein
VADRLDCSLPTRKLVDAIYESADLRLEPEPIPPSPAMTTLPCFSNHNALVRAQRLRHLQAQPLGRLVAGHKKDVVLTPALETKPGRVAIYGWHRAPGQPIQPLYSGHAASWVDYSHGIRLIRQSMPLEGQPARLRPSLDQSDYRKSVAVMKAPSAPRYAAAPLATRESTTPDSSPAPKPPATGAAAAPAVLRFTETNQFGERLAWFHPKPGVRIHVNAPPAGQFVAGRTVLLIHYALPNGNTIEQTLGRKTLRGEDGTSTSATSAPKHACPEGVAGEVVVLCCLENDLKRLAGLAQTKPPRRLIPGLLDSVTNLLAGHELEFVLSGQQWGWQPDFRLSDCR